MADIGVGVQMFVPSQPIEWVKGARIGDGGLCGAVYLGMNASNGLTMAVRQVKISVNSEWRNQLLTQLEREIRHFRSLRHQNILDLWSYKLDVNFLEFFYPYVPGGSLRALHQSYGAFEEPLLRGFVRQIVSGVSCLHSHGVIHGHIKTTDLLVDNEGVIKITDGGGMRRVLNELHGSLIPTTDTAHYTAPEVLQGSVMTTKADIWSIGIVIVELFITKDVTHRVGDHAPPLPQGLSSAALSFLHKALEPDPLLRPTAIELLQHQWLAS